MSKKEAVMTTLPWKQPPPGILVFSLIRFFIEETEIYQCTINTEGKRPCKNQQEKLLFKPVTLGCASNGGKATKVRKRSKREREKKIEVMTGYFSPFLS